MFAQQHPDPLTIRKAILERMNPGKIIGQIAALRFPRNGMLTYLSTRAEESNKVPKRMA